MTVGRGLSAGCHPAGAALAGRRRFNYLAMARRSQLSPCSRKKRSLSSELAPRYGVGEGEGEGATVLVVCGAVPEGEGLGVADGATVFVVCGWLPEGEALASGVTVAVGKGEDCNGVTVAVGRGPAGTLGLATGDGLGSTSVRATPRVAVRCEITAPQTISNAAIAPKILFFFIGISS